MKLFLIVKQIQDLDVYLLVLIIIILVENRVVLKLLDRSKFFLVLFRKINYNLNNELMEDVRTVVLVRMECQSEVILSV